MHSAGIIIPIIFILLTAPACKENPIVNVPVAETGVDGSPVTRSQAVVTAHRYARARWTMSAENRTGVTCEGTFLSNYPVGDRLGVGYKWGGWTDVDEFTEKVSQGYATGTGGGITWEIIPFDCVVGVSCTGLVSRAWHLNNKYTLNYDDPDIPRKFQEITNEIDFSDLQKGDVFINKYHVLLFVYESVHSMAMVIDSSFPGVRFRAVSWYDLSSDGYTAIRYNNIVDDPEPEGTISDPIELAVGGSDVSVDGNTLDIVSLEFHNYSIVPYVRETGPEIIYVFNLVEPGTFEASITQFKDEGIDNDIHLMESLEKDAQGMGLGCIVRGDERVEADLSGGTYYIIVDSRKNSPGEFTLTVRLIPQSSPGR